ncbi:hypothetical protein BC628DRAFT_1351478 [Trametes gibbosa]|nr:hypothetical protein BC628DRAFT_1351478 [Trametes gibbosa]
MSDTAYQAGPRRFRGAVDVACYTHTRPWAAHTQTYRRRVWASVCPTRRLPPCIPSRPLLGGVAPTRTRQVRPRTRTAEERGARQRWQQPRENTYDRKGGCDYTLLRSTYIQLTGTARCAIPRRLSLPSARAEPAPVSVGLRTERRGRGGGVGAGI